MMFQTDTVQEKRTRKHALGCVPEAYKYEISLKVYLNSADLLQKQPQQGNVHPKMTFPVTTN